MYLDDFLNQPAPRRGGEAFLAPAKRRSKTSLVMLALVFGFSGVVMLAIALNRGGARPDAMIMIGVAFVLMVALVGVPAYLFTHQDVALGRKLLEHGVVNDATVTKIVWQGTFTFVGVDVTREGRTEQYVFRCAISERLGRSLEGKNLPFVSLPSSRGAAGIAIEGLGIVTTR